VHPRPGALDPSPVQGALMHRLRRLALFMALSFAPPLMMGSSCGGSEAKTEAETEDASTANPATPDNIMKRSKREVEGAIDVRQDKLDGALERSTGDKEGIR